MTAAAKERGGRMERDIGDLRVGLIGYGLGGSAFHAPVLQAVAGLRLRLVVTSDPIRAAAARARYPGVDVVPSAEEVWRRAGDLDIAVIASPNRTHVPLGLAALDAGLHVVIDKPLAATASDGLRLVDAARSADRMLTVYHNRRWDDDFLTLQRLLEERSLGTVLRFESRFERWRPRPKEGWRESPDPEDAGGLLYDLGTHLIDQALVLFGPAREVYAELDVRRPGTAVDDDAFVAIRHESGTRSHLWLNALAARPGPRMRVLGTAGAWEKNGSDPQEAALRDGREPTGPGWGAAPESGGGVLYTGDDARAVTSEPGDYRRFYQGLVRAVRSGVAPPVAAEDAIAVLRVIEAARASAATGTIACPSPG